MNVAEDEQSAGTDPEPMKRMSGFFTLFKWFKTGTNREPMEEASRTCSSSSLESVASDKSSGTVTSFQYVSPTIYENKEVQRREIPIAPETDTYKARLLQRDRRREIDKNVSLRKKYNLFFNKEAFLNSEDALNSDQNSKSLPLAVRTDTMEIVPKTVHRRTNSESSKVKLAGAYLHVKGKRKAPQPPGIALQSTINLKRKKRIAPKPPVQSEMSTRFENNIITKDGLKFDNGGLTNFNKNKKVHDNYSALCNSPTKCNAGKATASPGSWYKRNSVTTDLLLKKENQHKLDILPENSSSRNYILDVSPDDLRKNEKEKKAECKSRRAVFRNLSEIDTKVLERVRMENTKKNSEITRIPEFMKSKDANKTDTLSSPKARSARDLISKFNAITGQSKNKDKYYYKQTSLDESQQRRGQHLDGHKKKNHDIKQQQDKSTNYLMKSESAGCVNQKSVSKTEKTNWTCSKCHSNNECWRIICHICSGIKPVFEDVPCSVCSVTPKYGNGTSAPFERSKTQLGFPAFVTHSCSISVDHSTQKEDHERLKKMLIEMKNSLPKHKSHLLKKQNSKTGIISESIPKVEEKARNDEQAKEEISKTRTVLEKQIFSKINQEAFEDRREATKTVSKEETRFQNEIIGDIMNTKVRLETQEQKVAEILVGTTQSIYEKISIKRTDVPVFGKVTSAVQTTAAVREVAPEASLKELIARHKAHNAYEPMKIQDFESIYSDKIPARLNANLDRTSKLSLFFNMPKEITAGQTTDSNFAETLEINRLLRKLEAAIAKGDMIDASVFAKELAKLRVNCSVIRQPLKSQESQLGFRIEMYVEDKISHRGPFPLIVTQSQTVAELKQQVSKDFEIPTEVQKWILGKELVVDDSSTLEELKISAGCPVFLYLVAPVNEPYKVKPTILKAKSSTPVSSITSNDQEAELGAISTSIGRMNHEHPNITEVVPDTSEAGSKKFKVTLFESFGKNFLEQNEKQKLYNKEVGIKQESERKKQSAVHIKENKIPVYYNTANYTGAVNKLVNANEVPKLNEKTMENMCMASQLEKKTRQKKVVLSCEIVGSNVSSSKVELLHTPPVQAYPEMFATQSLDKAASHKFIKNRMKCSVESSPSSYRQAYTFPADNGSAAVIPAVNSPEKTNVKILNTPKEWECHQCTLLNPETHSACMVCATTRSNETIKKKSTSQAQTYLHLVNLDNTDLVTNSEAFECLVCLMDVAIGEGVTLRECLHQFCRDCLARTIEFAEDAEVKCPFWDLQYSCSIGLQDREIKALVSPEIYEQHLAKSMSQAENQMEKTFHCKTPDCKGWCTFEDNVNEFRCPVCKKVSCLTCQAIHMGANCKQYQERMKEESMLNDESKRTKELLDEMVQKGEAIACPTCKVILMKKWGCDWLRCSMCKTEICWVTKGPRWGPAGKGDTSGGCQCGINGIKCHPKCNYCH